MPNVSREIASIHYNIAGYRFKVLIAHYDSWVSLYGWWEQEVKFNAGYGRHGIVTVGMTEWPILDSLLEKNRH
jgi:hypothetical protein